MLEVKNLSAGYNGADVIRNINFQVNEGECLCILGPNGSGKSTLLKCIARIIEYRGEIQITISNEQLANKDKKADFYKENMCDISKLPRKELAKKIALLSQSSQLFFPYTVYETVSMGRYAYSESLLKNLSPEDKDIIKDILIKLDIWDIKDNMIDELSGGTLQRVFLARTLAQTPDIILLDEPANHLDLKHQIELLDYLKKWVRETGKTLIGVFHDLNMARRFGDTALVLNNGEIAANGKIEEVLNGEVLNTIYGIDIRAFMKESLEAWNK